MSSVNQYRVWCTDIPAHYEYTWGTTAPTVCPSDGGPIDTSLTTVVTQITDDTVNTGASYDAFGRLRVSQLTTYLDLKQTNDQLPLFIERITSGSATSLYNSNEASTTLATTANNDYAISQTYQRGPYQSGKSAFYEMTFSGMQSQTNITKRIGFFNSNTVAPYNSSLDGIFFESNGTGIYFKIYRNGTELDSAIRSTWLDPCDGTKSCPNLDFSKAQILLTDFQWLGVGRVAFYFVVGMNTYLVHVFPHSNLIDKVYMSQSNHSLRWEIRQTGVGSGSLNYICSAFHVEGSLNNIGKMLSYGTGSTTFSSATGGSGFTAVVGLRLRVSTMQIQITNLNTMGSGNADVFYWQLVLNPTSIAGTWTWGAITNSGLDGAVGTSSANLVTGGVVIDSGYQNRGSSGNSSAFENAIRLGMSLNATGDIYVLCVRPTATSGTVSISGTITWIEIE